MEFLRERDQLLEKMFKVALKEKINLLARKYGYDPVFKLWTQIVRIEAVKPYFCRWRGKPDMMITEAMDCLDDYCNGLEDLLPMRLEIRRAPQTVNIKE